MRFLPAALLLWAPLWCAAQSAIPPVHVLPPARMLAVGEQDPMGERLFRTTSLRTQFSLAGHWQFRTDAAREVDWPSGIPEPETSLWVPGTWNTHTRYWSYIGVGWYQRSFEVPRSGNLLLRFGGVFYRAEVWLDGCRLGEHEGGYSRRRHLKPISERVAAGDRQQPGREITARYGHYLHRPESPDAEYPPDPGQPLA